MMSPTNRLLWLTALGVVPLSLVMAFSPNLAGVVMIIYAILLLVVMVDAIRAGDRLQKLVVQTPPLIRLSKDRPGTVDVRLRHEGSGTRTIRIALALPASISTPKEEVEVTLAGGDTWTRLPWPCTPACRGRFPILHAYWECASPHGFWLARGRVPMELELRVYPNLLQERNQLASLFLNRGVFGQHQLRQVGKGREFEKLREYTSGDSFEDIHWKATARRARPITKVYQIEKTQEIYVIMDASRLSARPVSKTRQPEAAGAGAPPMAESAIERYITAALVLGLAAERQGDLFGLLTFTDKIEAFVRAKNGRSHYQTCRDALYTLQAREVTPDFDEVASFIRLRLRRRAMLVFLTSLEDPVLAESFLRNMDMLCRQHLMVVNMLQPPEARPMFTNPDASSVDDVYRHLGGHLQWNRLREMEKALGHRGVQFTLLENERLCAELVAQYLHVKQRQLI
jgi:uncharacterized protein (DUF58 family)